MSDQLTTRWRVSDDAVANPVGDETVILHLGNGNYFGLNPIGTSLWEGLKAGLLPSEVCDQILQEYDAERDVVEKDIEHFLSNLAENDLIVKG